MTQNSQNLTKKYFEDLTKKTLCRSQKILGKLAKHQVQLKPDLLKSVMLCNPETPKKGPKMLRHKRMLQLLFPSLQKYVQQQKQTVPPLALGISVSDALQKEEKKHHLLSPKWEFFFFQELKFLYSTYNFYNANLSILPRTPIFSDLLTKFSNRESKGKQTAKCFHCFSVSVYFFLTLLLHFSSLLHDES